MIEEGDEGRELTEQEVNLALDQARQLGELSPSTFSTPS